MFREFVEQFVDQDNPIGDLANDILRDKTLDCSAAPGKIEEALLRRMGYDDRSDLVKALIVLYRYSR